MKNQLCLRNLSFKFKDAPYELFSNLSTNLGGTSPIVGILGRNGVGKTVLAKLLTGLLKPTSGNVFLDDQDITSMRTSTRAQYISMTFQRSYSAFFKETNYQELLFTLKNKLKHDKTKIGLEILDQLLEKHNLKDKAEQSPLTLSGGERRKLNQVIISIINPKILILDEPTVGFDLLEKQGLIHHINNLKNNSQRVFVLTHDIEFLLRISDTIVVLSQNTENKNTVVGYHGSLHAFFHEKHYKRFPEVHVPTEFRLLEILKNKGKLAKETTFSQFLNSTIALKE